MEPINMLLFCPNCGTQHIDQPQPEKNWYNPPHRSHECQNCHHVWRPADVPTNGVASIGTKGRCDQSPVPRWSHDEYDSARIALITVIWQTLSRQEPSSDRNWLLSQIRSLDDPRIEAPIAAIERNRSKRVNTAEV